jgi:hypothetical protein
MLTFWLVLALLVAFIVLYVALIRPIVRRWSFLAD